MLRAGHSARGMSLKRGGLKNWVFFALLLTATQCTIRFDAAAAVVISTTATKNEKKGYYCGVKKPVPIIVLVVAGLRNNCSSSGGAKNITIICCCRNVPLDRMMGQFCVVMRQWYHFADSDSHIYSMLWFGGVSTSSLRHSHCQLFRWKENIMNFVKLRTFFVFSILNSQCACMRSQATPYG